MTAVLAVDLGKTGCRAAISTGGESELALLREVPGAPGLACQGGVAAAEAAVLSASSSVLHDASLAKLDSVCVGAAGAAADPHAAQELAQRLRARLHTDELAVCSDAITSHAGALGGSHGVVLAVGTGAVAVGMGEERSLAMVDGWGPWLGDEGGGVWIGLAGLRAALRAFDERGEATALRQAAESAFSTDLSRLPAALNGSGNPAGTVAAFAPEVARLAAAGDDTAGVIMKAAADALAATVVAAARRVGKGDRVSVAITGGLTNLGPALLDPLTAALLSSPTPLRIQPALGGSLEGARLLALRRDTVHEPFVWRSEGDL